MKNIIPMILVCLCCYADWSDTDSSYLHDVWDDVDVIKQNSTAIRGHLGTISQNQLQEIKYNQSRLLDELQNLYLGYDMYYGGGLEQTGNTLGNYRDFYNYIDDFGNNTFQIYDETDNFNAYIEYYSEQSYDYNINNTHTANSFFNYSQYFNISDKMKLKLNDVGIDETDDWFIVDEWDDVKRIKTSIANRVNEMLTVPENLPNQNVDPNVLFTLNFNSVLDLMVRLGYWNLSPVDNWIINVKLIPSEGDYLYPLYTWWNSDNFYATTFQLCLKGLVALFTFFYCYNYVTSTWNA